jgi:phospholipase/carboxylesterase
MNHIFIEGKRPEMPTLLLLHGTGGNERDLLPLAELIAPDANVLGVRGHVLENGMPRFFRRLSEGVFDIEDLIFRTQELNDQLTDYAEQYKFDRDNVVAIGYSNGANIAASLLYHHENSLKGGILFHAMVPREGVTLPDLGNIPVFLGAGERDPLIPADQTKALSKDLEQAGAEVTEFWTGGGHQLTREEVEQAKAWFDKQFQ